MEQTGEVCSRSHSTLKWAVTNRMVFSIAPRCRQVETFLRKLLLLFCTAHRLAFTFARLVILLAKAPLEVMRHLVEPGDGVVAGGRRQHSGGAIRPSRGQLCCREEAPAQA